MKPAITILALVALVGCGDGDLTPEAKVADGVCTMFCDMCGEVDTCASDCFDQWGTYGTGPNAECANGAYLASLTCQIENGCGNDRCGDAYEDMLRCIENLPEE